MRLRLRLRLRRPRLWRVRRPGTVGDPKHATALRITQSHPKRKPLLSAPEPATECSIAWRICDGLSPRRHLRREGGPVVEEPRLETCHDNSRNDGCNAELQGE